MPIAFGGVWTVVLAKARKFGFEAFGLPIRVDDSRRHYQAHARCSK